MNALNVVIVDDEKPSRRRIQELLTGNPLVNITSVCASGSEALMCIRETVKEGQAIDLIFLDIKMRGMDGFEFLEIANREFGEQMVPFTIFISAFDQHALQAFHARAIDYLVKPFSDERFNSALERVAHLVAIRRRASLFQEMEELLQSKINREKRTPSVKADPGESAPLDRLLVKDRKSSRLIPVQEIRWIEAADVYVALHTESGKYMIRQSLSRLEKKLDAKQFLRIHRSYLINIDFVEELIPSSHGQYSVILKDNTILNLTRNYRQRFEERIRHQI